jgi:hypothetical protein
MLTRQMSMTTRLLETGFEIKFHALQIIFVRMFATAVIGSLYMWYTQTPDFPFGQRGVRGLLAIRGIAGSTGLFGLYCKRPYTSRWIPYTNRLIQIRYHILIYQMPPSLRFLSLP